MTEIAGMESTNSESTLELPMMRSVAGAATNSKTVATGLNLCRSWLLPAKAQTVHHHYLDATSTNLGWLWWG